jgi:enoyl-CoA hydratase/carnithine racemase
VSPGPCLLAKQLRWIEAMKILLTHQPFDAQEALHIGLLDEVVPHPKHHAAHSRLGCGRRTLRLTCSPMDRMGRHSQLSRLDNGWIAPY